MKKIPHFPKSIYAKEVIEDQTKVYKEIRANGEIVYLPKDKLYAAASYEAVTEVLNNPEVFCSSKGVASNSFFNNLPEVKSNILNVDGDYHLKLKGQFMRPITAKKMGALKGQIVEAAEHLVREIVQKKEIDVVKDFACYLPLTIVGNLVGLPKKGREKMLKWAFASFNTLGPMNWRTISSIPTLVFGLRNYALKLSEKDVEPGSWAAGVFEAIGKGKLTIDEGKGMILAYMAPSLDTTIASSAYMFYLLAKHPERFKDIQANQALVPGVVNEVVRLASPARGFTRYVNSDYDYKGSIIPKDSRIAILLPSANRDENKYTDPNTFNIRRNPKDHVGWGHGTHLCGGIHLARLELEELLYALCKYVDRLDAGTPTYYINNTIRGFKSLKGQVTGKTLVTN